MGSLVNFQLASAYFSISRINFESQESNLLSNSQTKIQLLLFG